MLYFISTFPLFQLDRGHVLSLPRHTTRDSLILTSSNVVFFLIARKESPRQEGGSPCRQSIGFGFVFKSSPQWARPTKSSFPLGEIKREERVASMSGPSRLSTRCGVVAACRNGRGREGHRTSRIEQSRHAHATTHVAFNHFFLYVLFFFTPPIHEGKESKNLM